MSEKPGNPIHPKRSGGRSFAARVECEPGVWQEVTFPAAASVRWGVCRLRQAADGSVRPDLKTWTGVYRLTERPERDLGLPMHWQWYIVMGYLGKFFKVKRPSPAITLIDVHSLFSFLEECEADDYWTAERVTRWQEARRAYNGKEHKVYLPGRAAGGKKRDPRPVEDRKPGTGTAAGAAKSVVKVKPPRPGQMVHPELFDF